MVDRWIKGAGGRIHVLFRDGPGPDLVFLPGAAVDAVGLTWKKVIEAVPPGYRVFAVDLPGFGRSDRPPIGCASTRFLADELGRAFARLGIQRPVVFGTSMGAAAAFAMMGSGTADVTYRALVLSGAYGLQARVPVHELAYAFARIRRFDVVLRPIVRRPAVMRMLLRFVIHDPARITDELLADAVREARRPRALEAFFDWMRDDLRPHAVVSNFREEVSRVDVPALLIHGKYDWMMPPESVEEAARRMPRAEVHVLESGHMVPRELPNEVNRLVHDFLRRHVRPVHTPGHGR